MASALVHFLFRRWLQISAAVVRIICRPINQKVDLPIIREVANPDISTKCNAIRPCGQKWIWDRDLGQQYRITVFALCHASSEVDDQSQMKEQLTANRLQIEGHFAVCFGSRRSHLFS